MVPSAVNIELTPELREKVRQERARRSLRHFVRYVWDIIEPGTPLKWGWAQDAICDHLEAVTDGRIRNLIINIPPRFLKSTLASICWPAWSWLKDPRARFLTGSYNKDLAIRDAVKSRRLMQNPKYLALLAGIPESEQWVFATDQNIKSRFENDLTGHRICTSVDSGATGEGGTIISVDDPHNVSDTESESERNRAIEWWEKTMSTRLNDPKKGAKVVIGQRVHAADLTGHLLEKQGGKGAGPNDPKGWYTHLCLAQMYESRHPYVGRPTSIGFLDPRTEDGEMLAPDHFDESAIESAKRALGSFGFAGQHQQRPSPAEGNIFQTRWFKTWQFLPPRMDKYCYSWDASFKGLDGKSSYAAESAAVKNRSYVVGQLWGFLGANSYLIDEERGQWNIVETLDAIRRIRARNGQAHPLATKVLVEDKANGPAIVSLLKAEIPGMDTWEPSGSKIQRAYAVQAYAESGNIWYPDPGHTGWANDWLDEIAQFPFAPKNDRVDAMTQALLWAHRNTTHKGPLEMMRKLTMW